MTVYRRLLPRSCCVSLMCLVAVSGMGLPAACAQDKTTDARDLLRAMTAARSAVFAGVVAIESNKFEEKGVVHDSRVLYFDKAAGCIRSDRKVIPTAPGTRRFDCSLVLTPQEVLFYDPAVHLVSRYPAGTRLESSKARLPFDPLTVGLSGTAAYEGLAFQTIADSLLTLPVTSLSVTDGLAKLELLRAHRRMSIRFS